MKRIFVFLVLVLLSGPAFAQHDVDTTKVVADLTRSELFRLVFDVNQTAIDSGRVFYSDHAGQDTTVSEDVFFDEIMSAGLGKLISLETQFKEKRRPKIVNTKFKKK